MTHPDIKHQVAVPFVTIVIREVRRFMCGFGLRHCCPCNHHDLVLCDFWQSHYARIGEMGGFDYMAFIVPGLIMMSVITNSYANVVSSFSA